MPAYFDTGFSVRQPMWHGQGLVLNDYPTDWADAREKAGLTWEPEVQGLYTKRVAITDEGVTTHFTPVEGHVAITRSDTGAPLGTATSGYQPITNQQMGELVEAIVEADGAVKFETAGSCRGGAQVWALAYLDEPFHVPGDPSATLPFFALLNSHDGTGACKVLPTDVRVVCWNTWNAASAQGDRTGAQVSIRHTGNVAEKIDAAKAMLAGVREESKAWQVLAADLAAINVSDAVVATFLDGFIPVPDVCTDRVRNSRERARAAFMGLYTESPTQEGITGTAYGLVQAAGEYLDHLRPYRSADTYLTRTMLRPEPIKAGAIKLVRELVKA